MLVEFFPNILFDPQFFDPKFLLTQQFFYLIFLHAKLFFEEKNLSINEGGNCMISSVRQLTVQQEFAFILAGTILKPIGFIFSP